jgi:hypothetical protein
MQGRNGLVFSSPPHRLRSRPLLALAFSSTFRVGLICLLVCLVPGCRDITAPSKECMSEAPTGVGAIVECCEISGEAVVGMFVRNGVAARFLAIECKVALTISTHGSISCIILLVCRALCGVVGML